MVATVRYADKKKRYREEMEAADEGDVTAMVLLMDSGNDRLHHHLTSAAPLSLTDEPTGLLSMALQFCGRRCVLIVSVEHEEITA